MDVIAPHAAATPLQVSLRETARQSTETYELTFRDESGQAFRLSLTREVTEYSLTYDRSAQLAGRRRGRGLALGRELRPLRHALGEAGLAARHTGRVLHRLAEAHRAGQDRGPESGSFREHLEVRAVQETVTLELDRVDPGSWSPENTAGRLRDFAVGLFSGGDRVEHRDAMARAMEEGYRQAEEAFGGTLPDVARETLDRARELLESWAAEPQAEADGLDLVA